jgi:endonuclease/exonuclease/phosphatase family metal-dependent hydrolase
MSQQWWVKKVFVYFKVLLHTCFKRKLQKNLIVKSTTFPHHDIHKHTWTSPDGAAHNQIDHVLIDKRRHSNILDVWSFRRADCDTDHYLVVAKLRERISVSI